LSEGSVEIIFRDGMDGFLSLKRTVYHTSLSKYSVNGIETTLENATALLKSKGLDVKNNSFMVLQGEVE
jgi:chromosome segregation ATPase